MISLSRYSSYFRFGGVTAALFGVPALAGLSLGKGEGVWLIMGVTFVTLLVLLLIFLGCLHLWKKKKGNSLSKLLRKDGGSVDLSGIESMRSNFENGIEKLQKANKNVYDLPWFLLAGQTGAGKTEAIRRSHSKEDFPPGLNDLMQGVGGTLNMNWWFTNKGIVLDTAGRIFEEKIQAGQSTEWQEFLKMLKKARKNMPINGFILAIPADSLIRDDLASIEKKASHIAEQITLVQNVLGVRFPVFILITKSDYIPGFREYVESISEPHLQQQMLGWSNPKGLDEPFAPENVESYLEGVIAKLKKRRLTYLLDPRPQNGKRLDDLDSLFTFPNQLRSALPNLRRYIEIVFSLNPWTQKPLFIRGIYFTSSLQQGDALDEALAEVMGKNLKEMALSPFKREIPLFLRDVFFEKIYKEYGLVTRAAKVRGAMRKRAVLFTLASLLGVGVILAAAWFGSRSFRSGVGDEYAHWKYAAEQYTESDLRAGEYVWSMPIVVDTGIGDGFVTDKDYPFDVSTATYTLPTYIEQMARYTVSELKVPGVFRPLKFFDDVLTGDSLDRDKAFRRIYEDTVILPIIVNAREKLRAATASTWNERELDGLQALIRLQELLNQQDRSASYCEQFWKELNGLFGYLTEKDLDSDLQQVFNEFYSNQYVQESNWPSAHFSRHYAAVTDLDDEELAAISHGLKLWTGQITQIRVQQEKTVEKLDAHLQQIEEVGRLEDSAVMSSQKTGIIQADSVEQINRLYQEFLADSKASFDLEGPLVFSVFYRDQIKTAKTRVDEEIATLDAELNVSKTGVGELGQAVLKRVELKRRELIESFDRIVDERMLKRFEDVDRNFIDPESGLHPRISFYQNLIDYRRNMQDMNLGKWTGGIDMLDRMQQLRLKVTAAPSDYRGYRESDIKSFIEIANQDFKRGQAKVAKDYVRLLVSDLKQLIGFPVFADSDRVMTTQEVSSLADSMEQVLGHLRSFRERMVQPSSPELAELESSLLTISTFVKSTFGEKMLESGIQFSTPSLSDYKAQNIQTTVAWRARYIHIGGLGAPVRMRNHSIDLGEVRLSWDSLEVLFTSTVDGAVGDIGRMTYRGGWAPLQFLLRSGQALTKLDDGKYLFRGRLVPAGDKSGLSFELMIQTPDSLPSADQWLRTDDLAAN